MTDKQAAINECRDAFEKWLTADGDYPHLKHKNFGGAYLREESSMKWDGWKTAWNTRQAITAPVVDVEGWERDLDILKINIENLPEAAGLTSGEIGILLQRISRLKHATRGVFWNAQKWQPIETAPRDGQKFIGGQWIIDDGNPVFEQEVIWWSPSWGFGGGGYAGKPTHWMPLPEPPTDAQERGDE